MAEDKKRETRASYSYQNRADLPGLGEFYKDAGKAKAAFGPAHDAQIVGAPATNHPTTDTPGGEVWARKSRKERLRYSDPHPPYALPAKQAPDEAGLKTAPLDPQLPQMSAEEFRDLRRKAEQKRARRRSRGRS